MLELGLGYDEVAGCWFLSAFVVLFDVLKTFLQAIPRSSWRFFDLWVKNATYSIHYVLNLSLKILEFDF